MMRPIYLDYNATTPIAPSVLEAMMPFLVEHYGNPSSRHAMGTAVYQAVEDARERVAELLGADTDEIFFTSGGTESINLALQGIMEDEDGYSGHLVVSAVEHPAVAAPANYLQRMGCALTVVPTDRWGRVDPLQVAEAIRDDTILLSVMHANNEIGTLQPIREIAQVCRERGVFCHTDASQSPGKVRVNVNELGVDLLTLAGHKMYAPKGVGALYVRRGTPIRPLLHGAGHERGLRPGTENVASLVGFGQAARLANHSTDENSAHLAERRDRLYARLREGIGEELTFNGHPVERLPNTLSVNFPRVAGQQLLERAANVYASTGAACHSGGSSMSATLAAIQLEPEAARGTVRLSLGWTTSVEEVDRASDSLLSAWESLVS